MATHKPPLGTDEDDPERIADYHRGADNSIKSVTQSILDERRRRRSKLSGVDDQDMREVRDPAAGKSEPER